MLELLDQVEDAITVDNDAICNKTTYSFKSQDGIANDPARANHAVERTKSHKPKEATSILSNSSYLALEVCIRNQTLFYSLFGSLKVNFHWFIPIYFLL